MLLERVVAMIETFFERMGVGIRGMGRREGVLIGVQNEGICEGTRKMAWSSLRMVDGLVETRVWKRDFVGELSPLLEILLNRGRRKVRRVIMARRGIRCVEIWIRGGIGE